jgi:mRNA interferase MazF
MVSRGDIWWAESPTRGRRPVIVLTRETAIPVLQRVMVVPATRTIRGIPSEVLLGTADGMPAECALTFDNIRTIRKAHLTERITRLSVDKMDEVCRALRFATGCG